MIPLRGKKYALVAITEAGCQLAETLESAIEFGYGAVYTSPRLATAHRKNLSEKITADIAVLFQEVDYLICIMATGIVIRSLAEVIRDKAADPAVLVLDEKGRHVISLLSGHLGGANQLCLQVAQELGACPVITTATDTQGVQALDSLAQSVNGWRDDLRPLVKEFNAALAAGQPVYLYQEEEWLDDLRGLTLIEEGQLEEHLQAGDFVIYLGQERELKSAPHLAQIQPKPYLLGVGARKGLAYEDFEEGFLLFCQKQNIKKGQIALLASIDVKKNERAIIELAKDMGIPFVTYSKDELLEVADKYPQSEFVKKQVGVGSVALAAADLASQGQVLSERFSWKGATFALAKSF
ncbi:cobalt-precorrin 5A hydrolase [Streptococcus sp. 10F2]